MKIFPSRRTQHIKAALTDNEYFNDLEKREAYIKGITEAIESPFGAVLLNALGNMEAAAIENLVNKKNESDSRAEIKLARLTRATLMSYVSEEETLAEAINQYNEMENGEYDDQV